MTKSLIEKQKWRGTTRIPVSSDLKCICLSKEGVEFQLTVPFEHRDSFCKWFDICNKLGIKKWRYEQ